jgi:hypothetical protein
MILPLVGTRGQRSKSLAPATNMMRTTARQNDRSEEEPHCGGCMASRSLDRSRSISTKQDRYDVVSLSRICRVALNRNPSHAVHSNSTNHQSPQGRMMLPPLPQLPSVASPLLSHDESCLSPHQKTTTTSSTATLRVGLSTLPPSPYSTRPGTPQQLSDDEFVTTNVQMRGSPAANLMRRVRGVSDCGSPSLHVKVPKHRRYEGIGVSPTDQGREYPVVRPHHESAHHRKLPVQREEADQLHEWLEGFCSLPLPEELLPMEDAPVDVYRCVVMIQEHRSTQIALQRAKVPNCVA